jgi:hypothetical protein
MMPTCHYLLFTSEMRRSGTILRKFVSIGGWCGPALILGKLGLRTEAFPFDFSRCTLDGVIHFIENGFHEGFFPPGPPPYRPECVGIWVLFRGVHTAFAHFDLNDPNIIAGFQRKLERWDNLLNGVALDDQHAANEPVTFFRTVAAKDPREELALIPALEAAIQKRNPNLDYRLVVVVHDQGFLNSTTEFQPLSERCTLWALDYTETDKKTLFDRSQQAYAKIVMSSLDDDRWPATPTSTMADPVLRIVETFPEVSLLPDAHDGVPTTTQEGRDISAHQILPQKVALVPVPASELTAERFAWRSHNNIALIDGVASVGGTCVGIGSTRCKQDVCAFCGNSNLHKAGRPFRTNRPFTDEEDELLLVHLYKILTGGDKVAAVEQLAHEMGRGAFEVICRIQFLTDSSTKIADGVLFDD